MAMAPVCVAHRVLHPGAGPRCPLPPGPPCPAPLDTRPPSSPWGWRSSCSPVRGPWVSVLAVAVGPRVRGRRWAPCTPSCVWPGQLGDCQWPLLLPTHRSSAQKPCSPDLWALVLSSGGAGRALAPAPPLHLSPVLLACFLELCHGSCLFAANTGGGWGPAAACAPAPGRCRGWRVPSAGQRLTHRPAPVARLPQGTRSNTFQAPLARTYPSLPRDPCKVLSRVPTPGSAQSVNTWLSQGCH